jgi:hypothetical protein
LAAFVKLESEIRACGELCRQAAIFFHTLLLMKTHAPPVLIIVALVCFALVKNTHAVIPPPDGGYPGENTAEGQNALLNLNRGTFNTAVGWVSLQGNVGASFNTAVGAGALFANNGDQNTATGVGALLSNTAGAFNTANGALALFSNTTGLNNTAIGWFSLFNNTGDLNTAVGGSALSDNITGMSNTAVGQSALVHSTGSGNTALGFTAGNGVTTANNVIAIGALGADIDTSCFIGNISGVAVTGDPVVVAANGQLGVAPAGSPLSANELLKQQRVVQELKATTERQAAVIALQEGQIKALTVGLQKVSAQLEASRPAPRVVDNP